MKPIQLTGLAAKEFGQKVREIKPLGCYFCKRTEKDKSLFIKGQDIGCSSLRVQFMSTRFAGLPFEFLVCHECVIVFEGIAEFVPGKKEKPNRVSRELSMVRVV